MIQIGFDFEKKEIIVGEPVKELCLSPEEENLVEIVMGYLADSVDVSMLGLEKRSNDYTTFVYGGINDFLRFKYSSRAKWISLRLPAAIQKDNLENPLFSAQKNKKQLHWKRLMDYLPSTSKIIP